MGPSPVGMKKKGQHIARAHFHQPHGNNNRRRDMQQ
jgi:hypothetical protein